MIGFPLTLPVEASTKRRFIVDDGVISVFDECGFPLTTAPDLYLSLSVSAPEAIAVRAWLERRKADLLPVAEVAP